MDLSVEGLYTKAPLGFPIQWVLVSIFIVGVILRSIYKMQFSRAGKLMKAVGGPPNVPLIGVAYLGLKLGSNTDFFKIAQQSIKKYGPVFGGFIGHRPFVYVTTLKAATALLRSNELDKSAEYFVFRNLVGDGILISNGNKWTHRRRMIMPSVGVNQLRNYSTSFNKQSSILIDILKDEVSGSGKPFDIEPYLNRCLLDISLECFIGRDVRAQKERYNDFVTAINGVFEINCERMWKPWLQPDLMWKLSGNAGLEKQFLTVIKDFLQKVMREQSEVSKESLESKDEAGKLLIDILLEKVDGKELTDKDVYDELLTIVTGARDTSTRTIVVTLFVLALYPDHQRRVQMEVDELFENDPKLNVVEASQMKYLECCIKESIRILTVVPIFSRLLKEELDIGDGIILPKGTTCHVIASMVHRDPEVYSDPDVFRPLRFLEDKELLDPYAFLGFSAGRRNCPGQKFAMLSVKTIISYLMRNFDISTNQTMENVKFTIDLLQKPVHPITFQFKRRSQSSHSVNLVPI